MKRKWSERLDEDTLAAYKRHKAEAPKHYPYIKQRKMFKKLKREHKAEMKALSHKKAYYEVWMEIQAYSESGPIFTKYLGKFLMKEFLARDDVMIEVEISFDYVKHGVYQHTFNVEACGPILTCPEYTYTNHELFPQTEPPKDLQALTAKKIQELEEEFLDPEVEKGEDFIRRCVGAMVDYNWYYLLDMHLAPLDKKQFRPFVCGLKHLSIH